MTTFYVYYTMTVLGMHQIMTGRERYALTMSVIEVHQIMTAKGVLYTKYIMTASGGGHQIMTAMGVVYTKL
jgi:hypothetical protein